MRLLIFPLLETPRRGFRTKNLLRKLFSVRKNRFFLTIGNHFITSSRQFAHNRGVPLRCKRRAMCISWWCFGLTKIPSWRQACKCSFVLDTNSCAQHASRPVALTSQRRSQPHLNQHGRCLSLLDGFRAYVCCWVKLKPRSLQAFSNRARNIFPCLYRISPRQRDIFGHLSKKGLQQRRCVQGGSAAAVVSVFERPAAMSAFRQGWSAAVARMPSDRWRTACEFTCVCACSCAGA